MAIRELVKNAVFASAQGLGVNSCLRRVSSHRLLVLCYHGLIQDDHPQDSYRTRVATRISEFRLQLTTVCRSFNPVPATDVLNHVERGSPLPPNPVLITFDDGFRNNLTYAAPELERLGVPALIHVATGHVGKCELLWTQELDERIISWRHATLPMPAGQADAVLTDRNTERWQVADGVRNVCKQLRHEERNAYLNRLRQEPLPAAEPWQRDLYSFLSWREVRDLDHRGFSIGSHTVNHSILTTLSSSELALELGESKSHIESELGKPCPWFAYPNGGPADFSPSVVSAVEKVGYKVAFTLIGHVNPQELDPLVIDRVAIPGEISMNAFHARINGLLTLLAR